MEIDESLAKKYPEEITIVLEHQFWDLQAHADEFEVTLKFGGIPKYLKVPYHAITRFHDPSVGFALQFDPPKEMEPAAPTLAKLKPVKTAKTKTPKAKKKTKAPAEKTEAPPQEEAANKVVSLDSFRKK